MDDGYSGVRFNRPGFQKVVELMKSGKVETLLIEKSAAEARKELSAKTVIHEQTQKWSTTAEQQIDIYFRYIGNLTPETFEQFEQAG